MYEVYGSREGYLDAPEWDVQEQELIFIGEHLAEREKERRALEDQKRREKELEAKNRMNR